MASSISFGATLTSKSGSAVHTSKDWGCWFSAPPSYSSRKRKESIVSIPFSDSVLDFSRIDNGRSYFEESTVTYTLAYPCKGSTFDAKIADMRSKQAGLENFLWGFLGSVTDDYISGRSMRNARVTSLDFTPNVAGGVLEAVVTFQGEYIH